MSSRLLQRLLNSYKALGQLAWFTEWVIGHDSQSQNDPPPVHGILCGLFKNKNLLFMNYQ